MADIDHESTPLGIIWETLKDKPFSSIPTFMGLLWNIPKLRITLSLEKIAKYLAAIETWQTLARHTHAS
jgi:hypothetical protein